MQRCLFDKEEKKLWELFSLFSLFSSLSMKSSLWTWSKIWTALRSCLLCSVWEKMYFKEMEYNCIISITPVSLSKLYWHKWRGSMSVLFTFPLVPVAQSLASLAHLNPKSSITVWSFNLLSGDDLPICFGTWRIFKALQYYHSVTVLSDDPRSCNNSTSLCSLVGSQWGTIAQAHEQLLLVGLVLQ